MLNVTKLLCDVFGCGAYLSFTPVVAVGLANPSVTHPTRDDHTHGWHTSYGNGLLMLQNKTAYGSIVRMLQYN
jgi:hypothetical protein